MRMTKTMHVDAAPEAVTSYLADVTALPPGFTMKAIHEEPTVVGSSYEWTGKLFGIPRKGVTVYTEYVPGERVAFRNFGAMEGSSDWTVEPEDGGSKLTVHVDSRLAIPVIGRLFGPIMRLQFGKNLAYGKRAIEQRPKAEKARS